MAVDIVVEVDTRDGQPVLVKTATTDDSAERLRQETDRLRQAQHPGVVELVEQSSEPPVCTITAWAGGRTIETVHPPLGVAAALLASLAATVADLHDLSVVHGRIDASHVVVDGEGRPRLCGFGGQPGPEVTETDDIAALGELIDLLVGADAEPEPIPERRWGRRRWSGYARRSLQTLSDQATDPDPSRRPTAGSLARAIVEIVPEARLAPLGPLSPFAPPPAGAAEPDAAIDLGRAERSPDEPVDQAAAPLPPPEPGGTPGALDPSGDGTRPAPSPEPVEESTSERRGGSATFLGLRVLAEEPDGDGHRDTDIGDGPGHHLGAHASRPLHDRRRSPRRRPPAGVFAAASAAVLLLVMVAPRVRAWLRPGPPRVDTVSAAPASRPAPGRAAGSLGDGQRPAPPDDPAASTADPGARSPSPDPNASVPAGCPPAAAPRVDVDGDGCPEPVQVHGTTVSAGSVQFRVGRDGDRLSVGDWNCDGRVTPAVVRPATGEVFVFSTWAGPGHEVTVSPTAVVDGVTAPVAPESQACGPLQVLTADGTGTTVTLPPEGGP